MFKFLKTYKHYWLWHSSFNNVRLCYQWAMDIQYYMDAIKVIPCVVNDTFDYDNPFLLIVNKIRFVKDRHDKMLFEAFIWI